MEAWLSRLVNILSKCAIFSVLFLKKDLKKKIDIWVLVDIKSI